MPPQDGETAYLFAGYRVDPVRGVLFDPKGEEVRLRPKPFRLLRHLLDHPGRLFSREELLEALWPGVVVTDDSLTQCVSDLRRSLGDHAAAILRTVPRRGYLLVAEVRRGAPPALEAPAVVPGPEPTVPPERFAGASSSATQALALRRRGTLLVHPVASPPGDETAARLAPVLVADLITELVRFEDLRVVSAPEGAETTEFALRIEMHSARDTVYAFLQLTNRRSGTTFWADRLEWPGGSDGLSLAAVTALAGAIDLQIRRKSLRLAQQKQPGELTARDYSLLGQELHQRGTEQETIAARAMFMRAAEADPGYAPPYAWAAFTFMRVVTFAWDVGAHGGAARKAVRLARKAVELDPESVQCQSAFGFALALDEHWEEAVDAARVALRLSRLADYGSRTACGEVLAAGGHPEEAVAALRETLALDPHCPPRTRAILGRALLLDNQPEEALRELRRCAARLPDYAPCARTMVVAAVEAGMIEEARAALQVVRRLRPQWVPAGQPIFWFLRRAEDVERFRSAFEIAQRLDRVAASGRLMRPSTTRS